MSLRSPLGQHHDGVLSIRSFRRLWIATTLSSLGDWLSLLALSALAYSLTGTGAQTSGGLPTGSTTTGSVAVGGVWITSLLPYLLFGPLAGAVADKLDRRINLIVGDIVRAVLYLSIPINLVVGFAPKLTWLYAAQFLACCASLFWTPAKDASIPNLVPREKLDEANGLSLLTTYGTAPIAALFFVVLQAISQFLGREVGYFSSVARGQISLSLYFNTVTFVISAITVYSLHELPRRRNGEPISVPSVAKSIWEGWRFAGRNRTVRGITIGMLGAFAAAGVVVGLGYGYVTSTLNGGPTGWGFVFAAMFVGLAVGMSPAIKILGDFSKRRLFGLAIAVAGLPLALIALIPNLPVVVVLVIVLGICAGIAYVTGYTIIGHEVDDDTRGRTFAFLQSALRVVMFAVIACSGLLAAGFSAVVSGISGSPDVTVGHLRYASVGINFVLLLAAAAAILLGWTSYRQMDDRMSVPLLPDLVGALRGKPLPAPAWPAVAGSGPGGRDQHGRDRPPGQGLLLAFEGGEGAGKSTQARLLAIWLRENGYDVLSTNEPGATKIGMRLRALLLDTSHAGMSPYCEALLYAADRAEHVAKVIDPALARGAVVIADRYIDSSLAYQGAGRGLPAADIARLNDWATDGREPDLTILLDRAPEEGLSRRARSADRLEAEPLDFHRRVRAGFLH
ncbi:MAG TPA: dTMP kinase, partial [Streptosporangiaceae bacterium]|nr:dTMP kinase [Streptosporangiaceae bacterium]